MGSATPYTCQPAFRAAAQAKPPEVYLRARRNEEEYLISVRNRVQKDLELVDGELPRSTKAEPGHGMGLVNVREVLDRWVNVFDFQ